MVVKFELQVEEAVDVHTEIEVGMEPEVHTGIEIGKEVGIVSVVDTEDGLVIETGEDTLGDLDTETGVDMDAATVVTEEVKEQSEVHTEFTGELVTVKEETKDEGVPGKLEVETASEAKF